MFSIASLDIWKAACFLCAVAMPTVTATTEAPPSGTATYGCLDFDAALSYPGTACKAGTEPPAYWFYNTAGYDVFTADTVLTGLKTSKKAGDCSNCPTVGSGASCKVWEDTMPAPNLNHPRNAVFGYTGWLSADDNSFRLCSTTCSGAVGGAC